ncbi:aminoglycoside N(3)-acetyltransferase [Sphingosinicella sp.]|uniref:aminoglycoside N(3)-acetyltransferase n=1 Tax=Sphingosinicella sp. TaxID=1917971 RepID=UPI004037902D
MTREDLRAGLASLGVAAGDLVMVHASLRKLGLGRAAFGPGGAEALLDALDEAIGPDGTLMMVLGTDYPMDWVYDHPLEARAALLEGSPAFDYRNAPVLEEVGWLAEAFRRRPGTIVSDNPSGRFGARRRRAKRLMADQPWHDYYGPGSPLEKLCQWGGKILRLGANPDTVTALHYAEYLADLPDKKTVRWDYVVAGADGVARHVWIDCLDDAEGIVHCEGEDYFASILKAYLALGRHREGLVGSARAELIDAADIVAFGARWMERNLAAPA